MKNIVKKFNALKLTTRIFLVTFILWCIFLTQSVVSAYQVSSNTDGQLNAADWKISQIKTQEKIDLKNFDGIRLSIPAELFWQPGASSSCSVNRDLEGVYVKVKANTVIIHRLSKSPWHKKLPDNIEIVCTSPSLVNANIEGAGRMRLSKLDTEQLQVEINGSGELTANGSATRFNGQINGAGKMQLRNLDIQLAKLQINGMGEIIAPKAKQVDVEINGVGEVSISAATETVGKTINGVGSLDIIE